MGQKINPISFRIPESKTWTARWFFAAKGENSAAGKYPYRKFLEEDEAIRSAIKNKISLAGVAGVVIERTSNNLRILIKAARPGLIIGQGGKGIEDLSKAIDRELSKVRAKQKGSPEKLRHGAGNREMNLSVNVEELKRSEVSATYTAQQIAWDLEKRMPFRRLIKKYLEQIMQNREVKGAKIGAKGRLDGAEIARTEFLKQGALPLQTLRADIDYGTATAYTTYGTIGIKVWLYKGEVFNKSTNSESAANKRMDANSQIRK